jgi:hypothetical protein
MKNDLLPCRQGADAPVPMPGYDGPAPEKEIYCNLFLKTCPGKKERVFLNKIYL